MNTPHHLTIIGSGPAGLTAAMYAARANLAPVVIAGSPWGGQLMLTTDVENFPGFPEGIQGPELMDRFRKQAERFGAQIIDAPATAVDFSGEIKKVTVGETTYESRAVIIATGADTKWLGLPSEQRLRGHGVSSCATCDGAFFREKDIIVVGGGDSAMEESLFLTKFAKSITVIHRRDAFRASKIMQERVLAHPKIRVLWNTGVDEFLGEATITGVRLTDLVTGEKTELPIQGAFIAIGHTPNTALFKGLVTLDAKGYVVPTERSETGIPGVFVSGDVHDHHYRQAITASGAGCMAAIDAERWLESREQEIKRP